MRLGKEWTVEEIKKLTSLLEQRASAARASIALKRNKAAVKRKARELGTPFKDHRIERREREAKETAARIRAGLPGKSI
jgi:hypothetical protein